MAGLHEIPDTVLRAHSIAKAKFLTRNGEHWNPPGTVSGVVGVGIGQRANPHGEKEWVIRFYVRDPWIPADIPVAITVDAPNGPPVHVRTEVVETGEFRPAAGPTHPAVAVPASPGCSIGHGSNIEFGTLGTIVRAPSTGAIYVLSANHVISNNGSALQTVQPGLLLNGINNPKLIATPSAFIALDPFGDNLDCALAMVPNPADVTNIIPQTTQSLTSASPIKPTLHKKVVKWGSRTGRTFGQIEDLHATILLRIPLPVGNFTYSFDTPVRVTPIFPPNSSAAPGASPPAFAADGDSGSLVCSLGFKKAIGVLIAITSSGQHAIVVPFWRFRPGIGYEETILPQLGRQLSALPTTLEFKI